MGIPWRARSARRLPRWQRAVLREFEKMLEVDHALSGRAPEIDLFGTQRGEHQKLIARPGDGDVEPAVAAFAIEPGNLRGYAAGLVGANGHRR
jgi:hypothetical protein